MFRNGVGEAHPTLKKSNVGRGWPSWYRGCERKAEGPRTPAASQRAKGCPLYQWKGGFSQGAIRSHVWPMTFGPWDIYALQTGSKVGASEDGGWRHLIGKGREEKWMGGGKEAAGHCHLSTHKLATMLWCRPAISTLSIVLCSSPQFCVVGTFLLQMRKLRLGRGLWFDCLKSW